MKAVFRLYPLKSIVTFIALSNQESNRVSEHRKFVRFTTKVASVTALLTNAGRRTANLTAELPTYIKIYIEC